MKTKKLLFLTAILLISIVPILAACRKTEKTIVTLGTPTLTINGTNVSWTSVANANATNGYTIKIGSTETIVTGTTYSLSHMESNYQISVRANGYETPTHIYKASAYCAAQSCCH